MVVLLVSLDGKPLGYGVSVANLDVSALLPHHLNYDSTGQFCESFLIPIGPKNVVNWLQKTSVGLLQSTKGPRHNLIARSVLNIVSNLGHS